MSDDKKLLFEVDAGLAGTRLDVFLATRMEGVSRSRIQKWIEGGRVLVNGLVVAARQKVGAGDIIEVADGAGDVAPARPVAQAMELNMLFEDEHLLVLDKPAGLVVHPGAGRPDGTLVNALVTRPGTVSVIGGEERPGIVHRLDKDTSGLMVVAKNDAAHTSISAGLKVRNLCLARLPKRQIMYVGRLFGPCSQSS